jgi:hypothetical protein
MHFFTCEWLSSAVFRTSTYKVPVLTVKYVELKITALFTCNASTLPVIAHLDIYTFTVTSQKNAIADFN